MQGRLQHETFTSPAENDFLYPDGHRHLCVVGNGRQALAVVGTGCDFRFLAGGWSTGQVSSCAGENPHSFFIGAVWFAIAHVCYSAASVMVLRSQGTPFRWRNFALLALLFFVTVFLHKLIFSRKSQRSKGFAVAATAYLTVVGIMASLSFLAAAGTAWHAWCLPIGACLFFISDCVLVVREYMRLKSKPINRLIMGTYLSGQLLLQIGLWTC